VKALKEDINVGGWTKNRDLSGSGQGSEGREWLL
jgi:hypothetical protein